MSFMFWKWHLTETSSNEVFYSVTITSLSALSLLCTAHNYCLNACQIKREKKLSRGCGDAFFIWRAFNNYVDRMGWVGSTPFVQTLSNWLINHVIYLMLRWKQWLPMMGKFTKWQLFSLKMVKSYHFEWKLLSFLECAQLWQQLFSSQLEISHMIHQPTDQSLNKLRDIWWSLTALFGKKSKFFVIKPVFLEHKNQWFFSERKLFSTLFRWVIQGISTFVNWLQGNSAN